MVSPAALVPVPPAIPLRSWSCTNPRKGDNIFVELLKCDGANNDFAYAGGTFMEHVGVCIITSWSGASNIIAALLDSTPMVAIAGQVPHRISCTDAFDVDNIPSVIHQRKTFGNHYIDFFHIVLGVIITT
jgi:hypothetical protein